MFVHSIDMKGTIYILTAYNFGTMFVHPLSTLKQCKMKSLILIPFLIVAILTGLVGLTQANTWMQFAMFGFGISMSMFMLGLIATEK
jgi:hypothetical protein